MLYGSIGKRQYVVFGHTMNREELETIVVSVKIGDRTRAE